MGRATNEEYLEKQAIIVIGEQAELEATLKAKEHLSVYPYGAALDKQKNEYYLIYSVANPSREIIADLIDKFIKHDSILVRKVVYFRQSKPLTPALEHLFAELRVDYIAIGQNAREDLLKYFDTTYTEAVSIGSLAGYKREISAAWKKRDMLSLGRFAKRLEEIEGISAGTSFVLMRTYYWLDNLHMVERTLTRYLVRQPKGLWAALQLARLYLKQKRNDYGVEILERLEIYNRLNPERYYLLGETYRHCGRLQDAFHAFDHGRNLLHEHEVHFTEGLIKVLCGLGHYDRALSMLTGKYLSDDGVATLFEHSLMNFSKQDYKQATALIEALLPCVEQNNEWLAKARYNLALGSLALADIGKARQTLHACEADATMYFSEMKELSAAIATKEQRPESIRKLLHTFKPMTL